MTLAEPGTPRDVQGTWIGDELARTLARVDTLVRALEAVQGGLRLQQEEIARLTDQLHMVDGRSQRHDAVQDVARSAQEEVVRLEAALRSEASLRRDLVGRVDRADARDAETRRELQRVLEQIASRLDASDGKQASSAVREHRLAEEIAEQTREEESVEVRLAAIEQRMAAAQEQTRRGADEVARVATSLPDLGARLDEFASGLRALQSDQRRMEEDVAALRTIRDREEELLDVLEQQRVTRARVEERLNSAEEALETIRRTHAQALEDMSLLAHQLAGEIEQRRSLSERIEAQRDLVSDHLRRALTAEEAGARRRIEEIERDMRVTRGLLVRLDEATGEAGQEQPL